MECRRSLLGKVWGKKTTNFIGLKSTLSQLFCQNGDLKVIELGFNYYQLYSRIMKKKRGFWQGSYGILIIKLLFFINGSRR